MVFLANVMAPYVGFGLGAELQLSIPYSMALTLLASFLERPFVSASGLCKQGLIGSIRANVISWALGFAIAFCLAVYAAQAFYAIHSLMIITAIPFSIWIEGLVIKSWVAKTGGKFRWVPLVAGNVFSGVVLIAVTMLAFYLNTRLESDVIVLRLREIETKMEWATGIVCGLIFVAVFLIPLQQNRTESNPEFETSNDATE